MPDVGHTHPHPRDSGALPIAYALRALPLDAPPRSAWPAVAVALGRVDARRTSAPARWPYALATAAALALALLLPVPGDAPGDAAGDTNVPSTSLTSMPEGATAPADLPTLMRESARLERLIAAVDADPLQPGDALVLGFAFEDELAGVDAGLAAAPPGSRDAALLWQRRVDVLSRYAELQLSRRSLLAAGQSFETTLVALH